ncbi:lytic murein transglycosylase [Streptomyces sp. NPDC018045]|uniref:lytic murein transglycosylase n=1 Tax=Streptomyces sp. NPDC018045 TaxID=3365037 RepID=UPI0037B5CA01
MKPLSPLPALVARRVRQGLCVCALAASLTAAAAISPLPLGGPARAGADEAGSGPGSAQARPRGVPALDLPNLLRDGRGNDPVAGDGAGTASTAGVPATALAAYRKAEEALHGSQPSCHLPWELVAGIGRVESVHASGYGLRADGSTARPIRGPRLDGVQFALIRDTDGGRWDGDAAFDRAVGPTQFIPSTWASWGADGNGDGVKDPNNIFDAALGTARYLCAGDRDLSRPADLDRAVLSYNNSRAYVKAVRQWMDTYRGTKVTEIPDNTPATPHRPDPADRGSRAHVAPGPGPGAGRPVPAAAGGGPADRTSGGMGGQGADRPGTSQRPVAEPGREPAPKPGREPVSKPARKPVPDPAPEPRPAPGHRAVSRLERVGVQKLEAEAGRAVGRPAQVRAVDAHGHAVPGVRVTFRVTGPTGGHFSGVDEETTASVTSGREGIATAPALQAGGRPGRLTVTATAAGVRGPAVVLTVTVRPAAEPAADGLRLWDPAAQERLPELLRAETGSRFPDLPPLAATYRARPAAGVRIKATVLTADRDGKLVPSTDGPYVAPGTGGPCVEPGTGGSHVEPGSSGPKTEFGTGGPYVGDAHGEPVRTWTLPPADADGRVTLPALCAGRHSGTYTLRLATPSGAVLDFVLTVTSPASGPRTF